MPSSKVQALALAALAATYIEAKTLLLDDLDIVRRLVLGFIKFNWDGSHSGKASFFYVLDDLVKTQPDNIALVYPERIKPIPPTKDNIPHTSEELASCYKVHKWTFKELYDTVLKYARVLKEEYGITNKDTVALDCTNKPEFIFIWFALWSLGATPAFINYNLTDNSLVHCIKQSDSKVLFVDTDPQVVELVSACEDKVKSISQIVYLDDNFKSKVSTAIPYRAPNSERHPEHKLWDTAGYIYTSGTTGLPKAAIISWKKFKIGSFLFGTVIKLSPHDIVYSAMPLYHSTASILGLCSAFIKGSGFAIGHKFSTTAFWTEVKLSGATYIQYVGETGRYLLNSPYSPDERSHSVKCATGNGMRPDVWQKFKERFNIPVVAEFFASTESPLATTNYQEGEFGIGAVGKYGWIAQWLMLKHNQTLVRVDPENGNSIYRNPKTGLCERPKVGEPGEFVARIPNPDKIHETFQGYKGNEKATSEKTLRNVFKKGDAYFRSGDLLKFDKDGLLYFVDRMGDTFRWKSENVSTNEVEEVISQFEDGALFKQVVVVGIKVPNHEGRAGFAVIELKNSEKGLSSETLNKLSDYLNAKLPKYAVPVFLKFVDNIELTGNNKVQKVKYQNQQFPPNHDENVYWLKNKKYIPLVDHDWNLISTGGHKL